MSWKDDLLDASFRGVAFHIQTISDKGEKSLAVHEYPYRAGAEVEDLGRKARRIPVKAVFWGDDYLQRLQSLVKAFEEKGKGELVHPVFGSVQATVATWDIPHEAERPDYAELSFELVESELDCEFFKATSSRATAQKASQKLSTGLASALAASTTALTTALSEAAKLPVLAQSALTEHLSAVLDVYDAARDVTRTALSYLDYPMAFISDLAAVQSVALNAIGGAVGTYREFSSLSTALPRLGISPGTPLASYPTGAGGYSTSWISGPISGSVGRAEASLALPVRKAAGGFVAPLPGSALHSPWAIQGAVAAHALIAQTVLITGEAQDVLLTQLEPKPSLTPQEVEAVTGNTRARMQDCMDYARAAYPVQAVYNVCEGMRVAAESVQTLGAAALHAQPPLTRTTMQDTGNFHLLAHKLYGDYTREDELKRINPQVRNPNFIAKGQELLVYAE